MSHDSNTLLLEQAAEMIDATTGMSHIPATIERLMKENDLDGLRAFLARCERDLPIEAMHTTDSLPYCDPMEREFPDVN